MERNGNNKWEWEGNGNKARLPGIGNENGNEPLKMEGNDIEKDIPAHLYWERFAKQVRL